MEKGGCTVCGNNIEFPVEMSGMTIACPHCGSPTMLGSNLKLKAEAENFRGKGKRGVETTRQGRYLEQVRSQTCYPSYRKLVYFAFSLMAALGWVAIFVSIISTLYSLVFRKATWNENLFLLGGTLVIVLISLAVVFFAKVFKETSYMLVDLSDMTAEENSRVTKL